MSWFERILPKRTTSVADRRKSVPEGVWAKCAKCDSVLYKTELERSLEVCPKCGFHMRINARVRLNALLDEGIKPGSQQAESGGPQLQEIGTELKPVDHLKFKDSKRYKDRLSAAQKNSGENEALIVFKGKLKGLPVVACSFDFNFMAGSMAAVVGEKFVRAVNQSIKDECPLICFATSGGARMQEALVSLFQMAKTSAALARLSNKGLPFISVLTDPTMGGVSASLAMLGDVNIGEPNALIGFAGPRVIEQTVRETLPEGFQRSEFLLEHGAIDMIVDRRNMRDEIASLLSKMMRQPEIDLVAN